MRALIGWTYCSGIGAPEVAAPWIDWRLASEIDNFPRAVLQARFGYKTPEDHNQGEPLLWGDMTEVTPDLARERGIPLPEIIVAGTPCQAFSVAGLRQGTADERGNLTLKFVENLHDIVAARPDGRLAVLWENVPGVLSDRGNAFGSFLGGLVGSMDALIPGARPRAGKSNAFWTWHPGGEVAVLDDEGEETGEFVTVEPGHRVKWPGEGMVQGPRARAAWAVLDAQYFGVAQQRRRVFVVVDFGGCVDPAAVLLEPESLRGHPPSREKAGQAAPTLPARRTGGGGLGTDFDLDGGLIPEIVGTLSDGAHNGGGLNGQDAYTGRIIPVVTHSLRGEGFDASEDGTGRGVPLVPVQGGALRGRDGGATAELTGDISMALRASTGGGDKPHVLAPIAYRTTGNDGIYETGDIIGALNTATDPSQHIIAFSSKDFGADAMIDLSPTLRAGGHSDSHANAGVPPAVAFTTEQTPHWSVDLALTLTKQSPSGGGQPQCVATSWAVRRLTPKECHRLQGFPDDHCAITYRGRPAKDGPQYKALGNSMAVPVIAYILERMAASMDQQEAAR